MQAEEQKEGRKNVPDGNSMTPCILTCIFSEVHCRLQRLWLGGRLAKSSLYPRTHILLTASKAVNHLFAELRVAPPPPTCSLQVHVVSEGAPMP